MAPRLSLALSALHKPLDRPAAPTNRAVSTACMLLIFFATRRRQSKLATQNNFDKFRNPARGRSALQLPNQVNGTIIHRPGGADIVSSGRKPRDHRKYKNVSPRRGRHWPNNQSRPLRGCLLYTSPSPLDATLSRMPSSA